MKKLILLQFLILFSCAADDVVEKSEDLTLSEFYLEITTSCEAGQSWKAYVEETEFNRVLDLWNNNNKPSCFWVEFNDYRYPEREIKHMGYFHGNARMIN